MTDWTFLLPNQRDLIMTGQVLLSLLLGGAVGYERERRNKPAGLRTHMIVAAGTTAFTLVSIYGFTSTTGGAARPSDPARVAAQIVSGIGFLGAGTIFRSGSEVRGLTTAATIWLVAALGMLVGAKLYWLSIFTTIASVLVLRFITLGGARNRVGEPSMYEDDDL